jgi:hypothetical protein
MPKTKWMIVSLAAINDPRYILESHLKKVAIKPLALASGDSGERTGEGA